MLRAFMVAVNQAGLSLTVRLSLGAERQAPQLKGDMACAVIHVGR